MLVHHQRKGGEILYTIQVSKSLNHPRIHFRQGKTFYGPTLLISNQNFKKRYINKSDHSTLQSRRENFLFSLMRSYGKGLGA